MCHEVDNDTGNGKIQFECEERHIIYGIMTLAFIMIPGHGIAQAFISRTPCTTIMFSLMFNHDRLLYLCTNLQQLACEDIVYLKCSV